MAFHVHLPGMTMFDTLQVATGLTFTGRMTVVSRSKIARLSLLRGRLVAASVDGVSRVGERLLKARVISREDLTSVLERQGDATCELPIGLLVSSMGLADARQIRPIVLDQLREACTELLDWGEGSVDLAPDPNLELLVTSSPQVEISGFLLEAAHLEDLRKIQKGADQFGNAPRHTEAHGEPDHASDDNTSDNLDPLEEVCKAEASDGNHAPDADLSASENDPPEDDAEKNDAGPEVTTH